MKYEPNAPAYPHETDEYFYHGLTTREWLLGQALQGCACDNRVSPEEQAQRAIRAVDETLKLLNADEVPASVTDPTSNF